MPNPIHDALFPPELWKTALEKYATAANLTVQLFDPGERPVVGPLHLTPLFELFDAKEYNTRFFARCARAALGHNDHEAAVKVSQFHGLSAVSAPLALEGKVVGAAVAGYVFAEFSQVTEIHWLARDAGISFEQLWAAARKQQPVPERRLKVLGELLQTLGEALLRENLRTRQYQHAAAIVASSGDAIISENLYGVITGWNPGAERLYGYSAEEVLGKHITSVLNPPGRIDEEPKILQRIRDGESVQHYDTVRRRKDGVLCEISLTVSPITDGRGHIEGASNIARDITERKRAEAELASSEKEFRLLAEAMPQIVWITRADGANTYFNQQWVDYTGLTLEESYGDGWNKPFHADDQQRAWDAWQNAVKYGAIYSVECRLRRADGAYRWWLIRGEPVRHERGEITKWFGTCTDIHDLKEVEKALRRSEVRLTQAVRVGQLGTFEHDHRSDVIEYSPVMRELVGFRADEEITFAKFLSRVLPEDREGLAAAIRRAHDPAGDGMFQAEYRVPGREGQARWLSVRAETFFAGETSERRPVRTIGAVQDVTERKDVQAGLERLVAERTAKLQELVEELEHFSYTITHDLKSPLRAMRGFAEVVSQMSVEGQARPFLEKISTSADRMDQLINDALNYSRTVRQEFPLEDVDAGALLRGILDSYPEFQPSKATIGVEGRLPVVLGNAAGLTQCFSNLLGNAVKFVRPGQVPEVRVWAEEVRSAKCGMQNKEGEFTANSSPAERESRWVRIWVEDKGIGVARELLPRVFDMFSRGSRDYEGTGIGLALVRKVVQRMGGRIGVESEEGNGSRFWMELKSGAVQARPEAAAVGSSEPKSGTVLYVEDEEGDQMLMRMAFAKKGMQSQLRVVGDGRAAIEYLSGAGKYADRKEYPLPAVVLLDLNLPLVPGFEVLKWMRAHLDFARTPVVVFSSSTREDDRVKALELGANEFVAKPSSGLKFGEVVAGLRERSLGLK